MCIVFHFTVNIKFCICLTGYKYILNVSRPFTTLTSLLGPTTLQLPEGGQHWTRRRGPAAPAAVAALERSHQPGMCKLSTLVLFRISLGGGRRGRKGREKNQQ